MANEEPTPPEKKRRPNRKRTKERHPLLRDRPPGVWYPDVVGKIPGYPRTAEGHQRRVEAARATAIRLHSEGRKFNGWGVPDGWAGQKEQLREAVREARRNAEIIVDQLFKLGYI